jgi:hypothetical protein
MQSVGGTCFARAGADVTPLTATGLTSGRRLPPRRRHQRQWPHIAAIWCVLYLASIGRTRAENRVDYRYEDYDEEGGRIHVKTQGAYFDQTLNSWASLKGNFIYDVISGATPTGAPWLPGTNAVNTAKMDDKRYAGYLEPTFKFSNHTLSPQFSYSEESDYKSIGVAVNDAIDFNEKNTTLLVGLSHSFDHVLPNEGELYGTTGMPITHDLRKDDSSALLGVSQLLGPATVATANLTLGYASGFLNDPYKRVLFDNTPYNPGPDPANPYPYTVWPESRPKHRFRQVVFLSLNHNFEALHGAPEFTYRFYHDDYDILANTFGVQWNQKIGSHVVISPMFRYYEQSAAYFYGTHFPGDPGDPNSPIPLPNYYSADYRLSKMETFTYGISVSVKAGDHLTIDLSYKRYEMYGLDHVTSPNQYPTANVVSGGLTLWF